MAEKEKEKKFKIDTVDVLSILGYEVDEDIEKVIDLLESHGTISENDISEILEVKINATRKLLYRLKEWGFADYEKQKDPEKTWWYIYFWSINRKKIVESYIQYLKTEIEEQGRSLKEEEEYAFMCRKCKLKYYYTDGLENNFVCAECNGFLKEIKNQKVIKELKKEIEDLKLKLEETKQ